MDVRSSGLSPRIHGTAVFSDHLMTSQSVGAKYDGLSAAQRACRFRLYRSTVLFQLVREPSLKRALKVALCCTPLNTKVFRHEVVD